MNINAKHIVMFSGGKDSTAMLLRMIEKNRKIDEIIFVDTTKEFPEVYEHIEKVENFISQKITKLRIKFDYWFKDHIKTKGNSKGESGYGWMDFMNRWCTALKRDKTKKYLNKNYERNNIIEYHGINYGEKNRIKNNRNRNIKYPLIEWKMNSKNTLNYCYEKNFKWNGLYDNIKRTSCYLCPLKKIDEIKYIYFNYPDLWEKMKKLDKYSERRFRSDYSLNEIEQKFKSKN